MTWSFWIATCRALEGSRLVVRSGRIPTWGIIILTVRKAEPDKIDAPDAGADDYVTKPFSMQELAARFRANLRRLPFSPQEGPHLVSFDQIEVNRDTRHVLGRGRDVCLTSRQFQVLHYLIANPNVAIPHGKILQAVWGPDYGREVEYLHVLINQHQLRKKIEPDPSKPTFILTESWFGYRFRLPNT
jgi:two-component system KDP operon response regulator KdpE